MRKSKKAKHLQQLAYKICLQDGHKPVVVDKRIDQERCARCDYSINKN